VLIELKEELAQREKLIADLNKSWEQRLKEASALQQERKAALQDMGVAIKAVSSLPHLLNLNQDPLLSSVLIYYIKEGVTRIGRSDADIPQDIQLNGLTICKGNHTYFMFLNNFKSTVSLKITTAL
jgi:kinesin family protein 1